MVKTVLYISYNGITEPLVQSQVLNYLEGLATDGYKFILLTFEKKALSLGTLGEIRAKLERKNITWYCLPYHHKPQMLGTAWDVWKGARLALSLVEKYQVSMLHARSFVPALIASQVKQKTGVPFVNDIRGFWVDEKAYKGRLSANSQIFRWGKKLERKTYLLSDAVVSLSENGIREICSWDFWDKEKCPMVCIPTCVDIDSFSVKTRLDSSSPVIGYIGSLGRGYLGREVFRFFKFVREKYPDSKLLIVSRTDRKLIAQWQREADIPEQCVELLAVSPDDIPEQVSRMDVGLSFIEPHYAKIASCPTKLGEYLAAGVPVVANAGIGDTDHILAKSQAGIVLEQCSENNFRAALKALPGLLSSPETPSLCRAISQDIFSLKKGIESYSCLYQRVLG